VRGSSPPGIQLPSRESDEHVFLIPERQALAHIYYHNREGVRLLSGRDAAHLEGSQLAEQSGYVDRAYDPRVGAALQLAHEAGITTGAAQRPYMRSERVSGLSALARP
jgi:hypothetical protein